jgi:predicted metal-dependent hydrolase
MEKHSIIYNATIIEFELIRTRRKTLAILVYTDMKVRVRAPNKLPIGEIIDKVKIRTSWITQKIEFFRNKQSIIDKYYYINGESHLYLGKKYCLNNMLHIKKDVIITNDELIIQTHYPNKPDVTKEILEEWYCTQSQEIFQQRIKYCSNLFSKPHDFTPKKLIIKNLKRRWGSMSSTGIITLNRKLICASIELIDYVIIHELCHMQHLDHSRDFYSLLSKIIPDWKKHKIALANLVSY